MECLNTVKLEVLLSAMHQKDFAIAYKTHIQSDLLIINQCDENRYDEIEVDGHTWRMISTTMRGIAQSRQMALDNTKGDICLFCDDDEVLNNNYVATILNAYTQLPKASAIVFNVNRINYKMKKSYYRISKTRIAPKYRGYSTQMLTLKIADIRENRIQMNIKFGSGSQWGGGEETLFEDDIRKAGLYMYEFPAVIATIDYAGGSQWFDGYSEKYFYNLGAYIQYKYNKNYVLKFLRAAYTCYRLRREKKLSFLEKIKWMYFGGKGIKRDVTYQQFLENNKRF